MKRKYKVIVENRSYTVTDRRGLTRKQLREAVAENLGVDSDEVEIADSYDSMLKRVIEEIANMYANSFNDESIIDEYESNRIW